MTPRHLYLHVPFCLRRCSYCDFAVQPTRRPDVAGWIDAASRELALVRESEGWPALEAETVYLGGGTPSLLGGPAVTELRERLAPHVRWDAAAEWTAEANPESFDPEVARGWRTAGVNRISLGIQSFAPAALRWMGRLHGPEGAEQAFSAARAAGFASISVDLIFGLPPRLERQWGEDLDRAIALEPDHVSLYGLTAEHGAALGRWVREGRERMVDDERYAQEYLLAAERLNAAGYLHYEVSNFARAGHESRHNRAYWTGAPYLGVGPGAHSFLPPERRWNVRSWAAYLERVRAGQLPLEEAEQVQGEPAELERLWLALRTAEGLQAGALTAAQADLAGRWCAAGWADLRTDRLRLTAEGWLLLDRLVVELAGAGAAAA